MKQLTHAMHELEIEKEKVESNIDKARREHTRLLQNIEELVDQLAIYNEHQKTLREAAVCELKEWRETQVFKGHTVDQLQNNRSKLDVIETFIKASLQNLKSIQERINSIQGELDGMGRLYRFPQRQ